MPLTAAQTLTLKNAISTTPILAAYPNTADGHADLAALLNKVASPEFWVWASDVNVQEIRARITWANLTPLDVPDGTAAWTNRALQCHGKQFAIQLIVPMIGTFSATDANIRAGLQDALTGVRSGAGGASLGAGWAAVQGALARLARSGERVLANTTSGNGSTKPLAATMTFEGELTPDDVALARV